MYKKGDIILIPFPFTDLSGTKVRPALVLHSDKKQSDVVVVFITSQVKDKSPHLVEIMPTTKNGIKVTSVIVCHKIATLDKKIIIGTIGVSEGVVIDAVNKALKVVLSL